MVISPKSISPLALFITGDIEQTPKLTGLELVELFNQHGSDDVNEYGKGTFPTRGVYVKQKLEEINNTDHLSGVIEELIDDRFYLDKEEDLETAVKYLNDIIKFDGYQAERVGLLYKIVDLENTNEQLETSQKGVDLEPEKKGIPIYLSKWAKEVVQLLLKKGEMKHQDILLALGGLPTSYNHISKIFKTKDAKEFLKSEIINNQSYYSLRDPSQFKK